MGSQFAYEDLASFEVDKYKYKWTIKHNKWIGWHSSSRFLPLRLVILNLCCRKLLLLSDSETSFKDKVSC